MMLVDRELADFEIVTALVSAQLYSSYPAIADGDKIDTSRLVDVAEAIVLEVVRRNDERVQ